MTTESQARPASTLKVASPEVLAARAALTGNLDAIEDKLNVPKQLARARGKFTAYRKERPAQFAAIVGGTVAVIAGGLFFAIRFARR